MAGESLYTSLTNAIVDAVGDALDHVDDSLPTLVPPDDTGARAALAELANRAQAVAAAGDPVTWLNAVEQWKSTLDDLADKAFGGSTPLDSLLVRVVEDRMPRTAAFLMLVGVIVPTPGGQDRIDRGKAQQFFTDPGTLVNEALWDALLGDASIPGTGRLPAVIVGALLLAPQTILGLARGNLGVAALVPPPTDAPGPWRTYRDASSDWLSFTVPLGDPVSATPVPRNIYDWRADLLPDLSATLAMRSRRVPLGGGKNRTEFELWLALALEQNEWRYAFTDADGNENGWFLKVDPGISGGFGYDGDWHGAFRQMLTNTSLVPGPKDPVSVTFGRDTPPNTPDVILGPPYDTRLVAQDIELYLRLREDHPVVEIGASVHGCSAVLTNRWWRTFGVTSELFGDGIRLDLDLDIAYVEGKGLQLNLGAGLDVTFHIDKEWGKGRRGRSEAAQHPPLRADPGDTEQLRHPWRGDLPRVAQDRPGHARGGAGSAAGWLLDRGREQALRRLPAAHRRRAPDRLRARHGWWLPRVGSAAQPERALRRRAVPQDLHVRGHRLRHPRAHGLHPATRCARPRS